MTSCKEGVGGDGMAQGLGHKGLTEGDSKNVQNRVTSFMNGPKVNGWRLKFPCSAKFIYYLSSNILSE